jgi:tripeptidyl-peptidase-1
VPDNVREHIDYITPGIKSVAVADPHRAHLGKRLFDWKHPKEPLKKDLPVSLETILEWALSLLSPACDVAITPNCIKSKTDPAGRRKENKTDC